MHRRAFLGRGAAASVMAGAPGAWAASAVHVRLNPESAGAEIPAGFMGLGYEISSVAISGLLSAANGPYVRLLRNLSPQGVIRVGGNTSDYSSFAPDGASLPVPKGTVINRHNLEDLAGFLGAIGWSLIWGLNLGEGTVEDAVEEARAVSAAIGTRLIAFQIGNEPDLFKPAHRSGTWDYAAWLASYRRYKAAIRQALPAARFAGPDVAGATGWVPAFAHDEGRDAVMLTHHYYIGNSNQPNATLERMLSADPKLSAIADQVNGAAREAGLPWRICETNSFSGGGKGGVSDTMGSALWTLDFMFLLAAKGCAGVNMETGVNHLGFISSYSPVTGARPDDLGVAPEYYGMLAFARGGHGRLVALDLDASGLDLTAYATRAGDGALLLTVINKEESRDAALDIASTGRLVSAKVMRLTGPAADATGGVRFGGAIVGKTGAWQPKPAAPVAIRDGHAMLAIPAASAAVISLGAVP